MKKIFKSWINKNNKNEKEKKYNFIDILYYISYEKLEEFAPSGYYRSLW